MSRKTSDPVAAATLAADVRAVMDAIAAGGVAIAPLDVAYAIVAATPDGIRRIYAAKNRSYEKPGGMFANWQMSAEIHAMDDDRHAIVRHLVEVENLPFSIVAPFRADHPFVAASDPWVVEASTKNGTMDMLFNAGQFHNEMARQSRERTMPVFGSSANMSLRGSKYRLADIEQPVLDAADICFDYGTSRYANDEGLSSTIIDFGEFAVIRVGHEFARLQRVFADTFDIELRA